MKRWELLEKVMEARLTLAAVTPALGVSYRQAKRLLKRAREKGLRGLGHDNRGRPPANKAQPQLRESASWRIGVEPGALSGLQ